MVWLFRITVSCVLEYSINQPFLVYMLIIPQIWENEKKNRRLGGNLYLVALSTVDFGTVTLISLSETLPSMIA